jgi:tetratricopeptide (TPR) repeat protein
MVALRPTAQLLVELDPTARPHEVERTLAAWALETEVALPAAPAATSTTLAAAATPAAQPATSSAPAPGPAPAQPHAPPPAVDPWASLRRALARGHLGEAATWQQAIERAPGATDVPGREPLEPAAFAAALTRLLEGIGDILSGDAITGKRCLLELTDPAQPNRSLRWLALLWSAHASMAGAGLESARQLVHDALELAQQLDVEARAASQLVAAELLLYAGKHEKALVWSTEARGRYARGGDAWGQGRAWLVEARIHAALGHDEPCLAAGRQARQVDPSWDAPAVFLAGRALSSGDLGAAERELTKVQSPEADRIRVLLVSVRSGAVSQADAAEFLQVQHAGPTPHALRTLERIANAWPRFLEARGVLAWMLLKLGRHDAARETFAWLAARPLGPDVASLVQLGLRCLDAAAGLAPVTAAPTAAPDAPGARVPTPPPLGLTESLVLPRPQGGAGALDAVFQGRLSVFSLPDLIEFLRSARRSGLLVCSSPDGMGVLRFNLGFITGASGSGQPGLAELLVQTGRAAAGAVAEVATPGLPDHELGGLLVARGVVGPEALADAVRRQIEGTLRALLGWTDGEFAFRREQGGPISGAVPAVQVDPQELLLNVFRELDEARRDAAPAPA